MIKIQVNGIYRESLTPISSEPREVLVSVDPSKSGSAIYIEDYFTEETIGVIKITIPPEVDHVKGSYETRKALRILMKNLKIIGSAIEDVITKKTSRGESLNDLHKIRVMLTFIFSSYIILLQDDFKSNPYIFNNQEWKTNVIPPKYNKKSIKGSKEFLSAINHPLSVYDDNVTDAYCICRNLRGTMKMEGFKAIRPIPDRPIDSIELGITQLVSKEQFKIWYKNHNVCFYNYNPGLTLEQNITYIYSTIGEDLTGVAKIELKNLTYREIYQFFVGEIPKEDILILAVRR